MSHLVRRCAQTLALFLGVSVLAFLFSALAPGNYFDDMRLSSRVGTETTAAFRAQYQFDQPITIRYARWLRSALQGDLGFSVAYNVPVISLLRTRARNTLQLTLTAMLIAWSLAVGLGVWSAAHLGGAVDRAISCVIALLLVTPDLVLALGISLLAARIGWFPTGGRISADFDGFDLSKRIADQMLHMILPVSVLVLSALPTLLRHVRSAVAEALNMTSLRAARSFGVPNGRLVYRYALPAAAPPIISLLGLSFASLLSGSLLVEVVMSWPGLGPLLLEAVLARDVDVVIGIVMLSTVFLLAGNFTADVFLFLADPRIRVEGGVT